jgi:hypothetical protein
MNDVKQLLKKTESKGVDVIYFISKHRTVIIIFVACSAILLSVLQAQSYLNPSRNEDKYNEIRSTINTKEIDQEILAKLEKTQNDIVNTAESNFVQDRTNPFAE